METDNLTNDEQKLFFVLRKSETVEMETLLSEMPTCSRHSMSVRMKYLAAKLAPQGWIIERVSCLGRGKKGVYGMQKKF